MTIKPVKTVDRPMPVKWYKLAESIVMGGMTFPEAGMQEVDGKPLYKRSYIISNAYQAIAQDTRFCKYVAELQERNREKGDINVKTIQNNALAALSVCTDADGKPDKQLIQHWLKANEQLGKTIAAFVDKSINANMELPPTTPDERDAYLAAYAKLRHDALDAPLALSTLSDATQAP